VRIIVSYSLVSPPSTDKATGKTIQTISLIALLREQEGYLGPHLIIAPLSTLSNWLDEFHKWTPSIPVVMYHGTPQQRDEIRTTKMMRHIHGGRPTEKFPVVCTSYEMVLKDRATLSKINWEFIIIVSCPRCGWMVIASNLGAGRRTPHEEL
jgi:ATP-dependent DNA helicase